MMPCKLFKTLHCVPSLTCRYLVYSRVMEPSSSEMVKRINAVAVVLVITSGKD